MTITDGWVKRNVSFWVDSSCFRFSTTTRTVLPIQWVLVVVHLVTVWEIQLWNFLWCGSQLGCKYYLYWWGIFFIRGLAIPLAYYIATVQQPKRAFLYVLLHFVKVIWSIWAQVLKVQLLTIPLAWTTTCYIIFYIINVKIMVVRKYLAGIQKLSNNIIMLNFNNIYSPVESHIKGNFTVAENLKHHPPPQELTFLLSFLNGTVSYGCQTSQMSYEYH